MTGSEFFLAERQIHRHGTGNFFFGSEIEMGGTGNFFSGSEIKMGGTGNFTSGSEIEKCWERNQKVPGAKSKSAGSVIAQKVTCIRS